MRFDVITRIHVTLETVWSVISDVDSEQRFWKGTLSIKIISREENVILRESRLAFRNSLSRERVTMNPKSSIKVEYMEGPMLGEKIIELQENSDTMVRVRWNVRMKGIAGIFGIFAKNHIRKGTIKALERIKAECEASLKH